MKVDSKGVNNYGNFYKKKDLRTGDFVVLRDGSIGVFIADLHTIVFDKGMSKYIQSYGDSLCNIYGDVDKDIMKVARGCIGFNNVKRLIKIGGSLLEAGAIIYDRERDTVEEMTLEEVCKALGKNIKIVKEHNND